jgi:hypothetical protein
MRFGTDETLRASGGKRWRALFLSDVHLGSRLPRGERMVEFLRYHDAETLYLVGIPITRFFASCCASPAPAGR